MSGRNFNLALRGAESETFNDIGNVIIHEGNGQKICAEVGLGVSVILQQLHGLDHVQDCTPIIGLKFENKAIERKLEDAIITSTVLYKEGLRPFGQNGRNRNLRKYVKSLSYFRGKLGMNIDQLASLIKGFEYREFSDSHHDVYSIIIEFVRVFENELSKKKKLTDSDKKIREALELLA